MKFEKVSYEQFIKDLPKGLDEDTMKIIWEEIILPKRATQNSAGYDFFAPYGFSLPPAQAITIPTGIKCELDEDKFLGILPRSSFGFNYGITLANTMGVIDADYYNNAKNEGHIFIKLVNNGLEELIIKDGNAFAQGIILPYFKVDGDNTETTREGGIGSTSQGAENDDN